MERLLPLIQALQKQHSSTIRVLALSSNNHFDGESLDSSAIEELRAGFPAVEELRIEVQQASQVSKTTLAPWIPN